jgi:hypothetical protein
LAAAPRRLAALRSLGFNSFLEMAYGRIDDDKFDT